MFQDGPVAVVSAKPFSNPSCNSTALLRDSFRVFLEFPSVDLHRFALSPENVPHRSESAIRPFTCLNYSLELVENKRRCFWLAATASFPTISSLFTFFSKCFSSFLRSTCSLSVSHQYLALEEVYLPFRAAIPNNPTLWNPSVSQSFDSYGSLTLSASPFQTITRRLSFWQVLHSTIPISWIFTLSFCRFTRRYWGNPS